MLIICGVSLLLFVIQLMLPLRVDDGNLFSIFNGQHTAGPVYTCVIYSLYQFNYIVFCNMTTVKRKACFYLDCYLDAIFVAIIQSRQT